MSTKTPDAPQGRGITASEHERPITFEPLEPRLLLSADCPVIELIDGDNRGLVTLTASMDLRAGTVSESSVRVFVAGEDQLIGTADDVEVSTDVSYDADARQIVINADVDADSRYRVVVNGDAIVGANGVLLDAEFNEFGFPTGDGTPGGELNIYSRTASDTIVRIVTPLGEIEVEMFPGETPITVANFLEYANNGIYDQSFFHRLDTDFVIQGGGFFADDELSNIPENDPILNEPGISNTRGTIAMAKMAGNPNSATNEFFFNLGNNSTNLDNQNGGFTVFGRVTNAAGLAVLDALEALAIVDATSQGGALGELPVLDEDAFTDAGDIAEPDNLASFLRVSLLVEFDDEPFQQLDLEDAVVFSEGGNASSVYVLDLNGSGQLMGADFLDVKFGNNDSIRSITIAKDAPNVPMAFVISNAEKVGSFNDKRRGDVADIGYIISSAEIDQIKVKGSISGMDLNNVVAPGIIFSEDIDGDGQRDDALAVYVERGFVNKLDIGGDLNGDVVINDGVSNVKVKGDTRNANFVIGDDGRDRMLKINLASVDRSGIDSMMPISAVNVDAWSDTGVIRHEIAAPAIGKIKSKGDFDAGVDIGGDAAFEDALGSVSIKGDIFDSRWDVGGDAGAVKIKGDVTNWRLDVGGAVKQVSFAYGGNVTIITEDTLGSLKADEIFGGFFELDTADKIKVKGDAVADIVFPNSGSQSFIVRNATINGNFEGVLSGTVGIDKLTVKGDVNDAEFRFSGPAGKLKFGEVDDTAVELLAGVRKIEATNWEGGEFRGTGYGRIIMKGGGGANGDFRADLLAGTFERLETRKGGDFEGVISSQSAEAIRIAGDIVESEISLNANIFFVNPTIQEITVGGVVELTNIRISGRVDLIQARGFFDALVVVGGPNGLFRLPDSGAGFDQFASLGDFVVTGVAGGGESFRSSYVSATRIDSATILMPDTTNGGAPMGLAAGSFGKVTTIFEDETIELNNPSATPAAINDYEIRVNFAAPA